MKVRNKWNNRLYEVVQKDGKYVTLKREDGSTLRIALSEYSSIYREDEDEED